MKSKVGCVIYVQIIPKFTFEDRKCLLFPHCVFLLFLDKV